MNDDFRIPRQTGIYDGVLLVDKPSGPTSHDIVAMIKRRFNFNKVGHGGTLDPQATGLLVVLIEHGTKLSGAFLSSDKTYEGVMLLGISTDTQDAQGKVLREADFSHVTRELLDREMLRFTGDLMQAPPMVSAAKKDGVPLYKLARKGQTVEREEKLIHIYNFDLVDFTPPRVSFVLKCTKGTYVRTICSDLGDRLGCGANLEQLRRTASGEMKVEDAVPAARILQMSKEEVLDKIIQMHKFMARQRIRPVGKL